MNFLDATILSFVEGLTEFLPISSTGHMILASAFLKLPNSEFLKTFEISIQLGAILAIVFIYFKQLSGSLKLLKKLFIAFLPTAFIGLLFYKIIKAYLFNPLFVSLALILGGVILIFLNSKIEKSEKKYLHLEDISYKNAFLIGLFQSFSIIPGVSRAGATIIGGIFNCLDKKQATEFSFLLAVPTMLAATGYDLLKTSANFDFYEVKLIGFGVIFAFISAWLAIKFFLYFVQKYNFAYFGYYRIILGIIFILFYFLI